MATLKKKTPLQRVLRQNRIVVFLSLFIEVVSLVLSHFDVLGNVFSFVFLLNAVFFFFSTRFLRSRIITVIRAPLLNDLDLEEYRARLAEAGWDTKSPSDMLLAALASGDHQRALDIAATVLAHETYEPTKLTFLTFLCLSQFIQGDLPAMQQTIREADALASIDRRAARAAKKSALLSFLRHFSNGELELCEADFQRLPPKKQNAYLLLQSEFLHAALYAQRHEQERAEQALNAILAHEKTLPVFAEAAEAQLLATQRGEGYVGLGLSLTAETQLPPFPSVAPILARKRRFFIALATLSVLLLLAIAGGIVSDKLKEKREWQERSDKLEAEVVRAMPNEEVELLANLEVSADGKVIDEICVLRRAENKILVGTRYERVDGDGTVYFDPYCMDMRQSTILQQVANFDRTYTVTYRLYRDKDDVPTDAHSTTKFKLNDTTLYFCVTGIEKQ